MLDQKYQNKLRIEYNLDLILGFDSTIHVFVNSGRYMFT